MEETGKPKTKRPRVSISRGHGQDALAAELLTLLETMTADGTISEQEIRKLGEWLESNKKDSALPASEFLCTTVRGILADGKVAPGEKIALYKAIEKVLPPQMRRLAKARRDAIERLDYERNRPIAQANFVVAGVSYERRAEVIERYATEGAAAYLARDPDNAYDRNAIEIRLKNGYQIGFVPRENAAELAPYFDAGCRQRAYLTKILRGRRIPTPVVQCYLYPIDSTINGAIPDSEIPAKNQATLENKHLEGMTCAIIAVTAFGFLFLVILWILH